MSDINLLVFGCMVSFIALGGVYVYLRECFTAEEPPRKAETRTEEVVSAELRDVA